MNSMNLPVNLFDLVLLAVVIAGILRGRKHGMSEEFLNLLKWLSVVVGCSFLYEPVGRFFVSSSSVFSLLSCYIMAYIASALLILGMFALLKRSLGGKLLGSDIFGRSEYYLGMGSGLVRFSCILVSVLALLNARAFNSAEVKAMENFQNREFGSNYFPTLYSIQAAVFEKSLAGPLIQQYLGFLLIKPTRPESKQFQQREYSLP